MMIPFMIDQNALQRGKWYFVDKITSLNRI